MVSKNEIKLITSLQQKKYRTKHQLFVVEGIKSVKEFVQSKYPVYQIYVTEDIHIDIDQNLQSIISKNDLKRITNLKNSSGVVGIFKIPKLLTKDTDDLQIILDEVKDPGNLGTIIRLCDWFGISQLICSTGTVDCYNPKVIQATMGSLTRVNVIYTDIKSYLKKEKVPVYVSNLSGENLYKKAVDKKAILVMGNEANGISPEIMELADKEISIPRFGENSKAESLNVATATAIFLGEFRRQNML
jgi:TrmH family RNA methyltransferase